MFLIILLLSYDEVFSLNFKLIFQIAKGGYGSVALYKKISTGDMYAIKTVDIQSMKEKKLSSTLKTNSYDGVFSFIFNVFDKLSKWLILLEILSKSLL